ncbi:hypothetical protein CEXT_179721 [Caerostris extrusa]|uniref:Uncharacterized protein n=1 Tax=Caerostris extrusa TaxID=172846 RepID=A0AAV4WED8_CAEEX|nr:hypothetical protein CEXT_179721 [Caerostris extrusa]
MIRPISNRQLSPDCRILHTQKAATYLIAPPGSGVPILTNTIASPSPMLSADASGCSLLPRLPDVRRSARKLIVSQKEAFSLLNEFSLHVTTVKRNLILEKFLGDRFRQQRSRCVARSGKKDKRGSCLSGIFHGF